MTTRISRRVTDANYHSVIYLYAAKRRTQYEQWHPISHYNLWNRQNLIPEPILQGHIQCRTDTESDYAGNPVLFSGYPPASILSVMWDNSISSDLGEPQPSGARHGSVIG